MRSTLLVLLVALGAAPAGARADLTLRLGAFDGPADPAPRPHLELPALALDGMTAPAFVLDEGGGAGRRGHRADPAVSLILGIIPGFGIGHLIAGAQQWIYWLIADILIFAVWPGGFFYFNGSGYPFLGLLVLVERIVEGISAFQAAGGGPVFRSERGFAERGFDSPAALALPVGSRSALLR